MARLVRYRSKTIMVIAIAVIIILAITLYAIFTIVALTHTLASYHAAAKLVPSISGSVTGTSLLFYNEAADLMPYVLVNYNARNVSELFVNSSLYSRQIPTRIYILNTSNECISCNNVTEVRKLIANDLIGYDLISKPSQITTVNISGVSKISNDSILIVLNGLLPQQFLENVAPKETLLQELLYKGTSVIYVGENFKLLIQPQSIIIPNKNISYFLQTNLTSYNSTFNSRFKTHPLENFAFDNQTFSFINGANYGPLTYVNVYNGSIVAFSNYIDSWSSQSAAQDIAKSISELFWLPKYSGSLSEVSVPSLNYSSKVGLFLNDSNLTYTGNASITNKLNASHGRVVIYTNSNYSIGNDSDYIYLPFLPRYALNGTIALPTKYIIPGQALQIPMTIFTHSLTPVTITPSLYIYDSNFTFIQAKPLPSSSAAGNFVFEKSEIFSLPPGRYILSLYSFSDYPYAETLLDVPQANIQLTNGNFENGTYSFFVAINHVPLSNINYTIKLNGKYSQSGAIKNGNITYLLPRGTPQIFGNLNFTINMLSTSFTYDTSNIPVSITVTGQDIDLIIVGIVVILLVTVVKGPNRDEFYIDVPKMPKPNTIGVKVKSRDVVSAFDKLNIYYHWKNMPLSKEEARTAIANNIRYNGMPVAITYSNTESILNLLVGTGQLVSADNLFAPKEWTMQGHDIEYLATFKKLRIWFVTHAYMFTDIDVSTYADMVATVKGERVYIIIYSPTSKYKNLPVYQGVQTYIAFLNQEALLEFKDRISEAFSPEIEELKLYITSGQIKLIDADNIDASFT